MPKGRRMNASASFDETVVAETRPVMQVGFGDDLVPKFSGQDKIYAVSRWIQDVEDNAEILQWTPLQQLIVARRSLVGTAALWLKSERPFKTWDEMKQALAKEFPDSIDQKTLHETMASRKKHEDESCLDYLLVMKELGKRGRMADYVAIKYIIEGIQDAECNKIMLYGATTYPELKEKLRIYEVVKEKLKIEGATRRPREPMTHTRLPRLPALRCYNCGERNHHSRECPHQHLGLKCFKCNGFGHIATSCNVQPRQPEGASQSAQTSTSGIYGGQSDARTSRPNFRGQQSFRQVGNNGGGETRQLQGGPRRTMFAAENQDATTEGSTYANMADTRSNGVPIDMSIDHIDRRLTTDSNEVMLNVNKDVSNTTKEIWLKKPEKDVKIMENMASALIDTGSEVNLMSETFYNTIGCPKCDEEILALSGLGQMKVHSMGKLTVPVIIDGHEYHKVSFHVVSKDSMPYKLIIGQDFLQNVTMLMNEGNIMLLPSSEDWLRNISCFVSDSIYDIGCEASPAIQQQVQGLVEGYQPMKTKDAPIQLRIILKDDIPVAQRPRRLAISEQEEVERQIEQWLKDGIIQLKLKDRP
ncbi:uncharacterized protein LOC125490642 [Plutella xylostella]|uniref:uncharacterized protein LOC125490642 n=1 Tax=Plutella xylostella TaxID=51655 RepID=UPI002032500B|nr:uncharacterized protein LOC125490642 [Plutella xylostella]